ncbi:phenylalanyl-tRNA synthetase beta subunit [Fulvimarina pelagi HTCC2506]|uniref:Phenylalanyl-tRNA synthetase beta subunit n=1 Tax=Fulvimarina pelagi HTCC2506 TaxID=314231 RepID=Q0G2L5_9HYPH|nr:phenylalanyl-tRNA synthetase beta subunit [Fulvimarina pelagi HTCC2506]
MNGTREAKREGGGKSGAEDRDHAAVLAWLAWNLR